MNYTSTNQLKWVKSAKYQPEVTPNEIIDAYAYGLKKGREELIQTVKATIKDRLGKTKDILANFYVSLAKRGIKPTKLALRTHDLINFEGVYVIDSKQYSSDAMKKVFKSMVKIEKEFNTNSDFKLRIWFVPILTDEESVVENLNTFDWFYVD